MKNNFIKIVAMLLMIFACTFAFTACGEGEEEIKLTEAAIKSELANSDGTLNGTLTIESGTSDDVTAFYYVVTDVNASELVVKSTTRKAAETLLSNSANLTYGQYKICNAFNAVVQITSIFIEDTNSLSADAYTEDVLSIICDSTAKTYGNWTVSAVVNQASDSITIKAVHN